jgi:hypothetical protein
MMDFNQQRQLEEEYYHYFQSLQNGLSFFKSLQQDSEETRIKINTLLYRPLDAPSTWTDLFQLRIFPDFPTHLDQFEHGQSIAHVENPDTFQVGRHDNNKRLLFLSSYSALLKEEIPDESVRNFYFNMDHPTDRILFALFQRDNRGYKSKTNPTLSFLQRRCLIREAVKIAKKRAMNNQKGKNTRYQVILNDIDLAIDKVLSMTNNNITEESTANDSNDQAYPAATQNGLPHQQDPAAPAADSNFISHTDKKLPSNQMYNDATHGIIDELMALIQKYKFLEFAKTGQIFNPDHWKDMATTELLHHQVESAVWHWHVRFRGAYQSRVSS